MQAAFTEDGLSMELHVGHIVSVLSISLFVMGLGLGPLVVGPLSEIYGRNPIYRISYGLFFALAWPVAFAPNIGADSWEWHSMKLIVNFYSCISSVQDDHGLLWIRFLERSRR